MQTHVSPSVIRYKLQTSMINKFKNVDSVMKTRIFSSRKTQKRNSRVECK